MTHSVEEYYRKIEFLHTRAIELHRERYKTTDSYDKIRCEFLVDDIKYLARILAESQVDMEREFGQSRTQHK
jgi:hypothetical protein|tara:strand:- start:758 stop:973 length:216 start_codon:yes stop_codon:yes gene_type:complete